MSKTNDATIPEFDDARRGKQTDELTTGKQNNGCFEIKNTLFVNGPNGRSTTALPGVIICSYLFLNFDNIFSVNITLQGDCGTTI